MNKLLQEPKFLEMFYQLDIDENQIASKLKEYLPSIEKWSKTYLRSTKTGLADSNNVYINDIVDIEENIWSPFLGFKGNCFYLIFTVYVED